MPQIRAPRETASGERGGGNISGDPTILIFEYLEEVPGQRRWEAPELEQVAWGEPRKHLLFEYATACYDGKEGSRMFFYSTV